MKISAALILKEAALGAFWKMIYNDNKNYKKCFYYENNNNLVDCNGLNKH